MSGNALGYLTFSLRFEKIIIVSEVVANVNISIMLSYKLEIMLYEL